MPTNTLQLCFTNVQNNPNIIKTIHVFLYKNKTGLSLDKLWLTFELEPLHSFHVQSIPALSATNQSFVPIFLKPTYSDFTINYTVHVVDQPSNCDKQRTKKVRENLSKFCLMLEKIIARSSTRIYSYLH